jgi:synaptic vesicle membrane protein VAT-1
VKARYQKEEAGKAAQRFETWAKQSEHPIQVNFSSAEMLELVKEGLGRVVRRLGQLFIEEVLESEAEQIAGPRSKPLAERSAYRWGREAGYCVIDGQKVPIARPRVRSKMHHREIPLGSYELFQRASLLEESVWHKIMHGLSTRNYKEVLQQFSDAYGVKKSTVSEHFVEASRKKLETAMTRSLAELAIDVMMIDGTIFKGFNLVVAIGIDRFGHKILLGLRQGATENAAVVGELLAELAERGLKFTQPRLYVVDGGKAIRRALLNHAGDAAFIQRCQVHKIRNVCDHLPEHQRPAVKYKMRCAYETPEAADAKQGLWKLHDELVAIEPERGSQFDGRVGGDSYGARTAHRQETAAICSEHQRYRVEFLRGRTNLPSGEALAGFRSSAALGRFGPLVRRVSLESDSRLCPNGSSCFVHESGTCAAPPKAKGYSAPSGQCCLKWVRSATHFQRNFGHPHREGGEAGGCQEWPPYGSERMRRGEFVARMKKVVITAFGDESKLAVIESDLRDPVSGEVQLAVEYTIVSGSDVSMRRGTYPFQKKPPLTPGYSVIGKVRLNGQGCTQFKIGDRVACLSKYDGQAELINLPEKFLVSVPEGVDLKAAVALILDWVTAYQMLEHATHVKAGQKIFVHALSGAVGGAFLRLANLRSAQVFGTASAKKHDELRELGAVPFDYSNKDWIAVVKKLGGVDAVFDPLGFESFDESYSILGRGGILVGYGMNLPSWNKTAQRSVIPSALKLFSRNLLFWQGKRTTFFGVNRSSKNFAADLRLLFEWLRDGKISVPIRATFKLDQIQEAHREYASGAGMGSIVIEVNP